MKRSTLLPVLVVVMIALLTLTVVVSGRSNDPGIRGDAAYPHYACQITRYCEGDTCSEEPIPLVAYLSHEDDLPRLELRGFNPQATLTEVPDGYIFESDGGEVRGSVAIFNDRGLDITGISGSDESPIEHFASGRCDRLVEP